MWVITTLQPEELHALEASPVCLYCQHRALLHHYDADNAEYDCHICHWSELIVTGAFSPWHPPR